MKAKPISLTRRSFVIAGLSGVTAPAFAFQAVRTTAVVGPCVSVSCGQRVGRKLVVSGRIVDGHGRAVAGATVDAWHPDVHRTSVVTDADGRFMFTTTTPRAESPISYSVTRRGHAADVRRLDLAHAQSDDAGV